MPTRNVNLTEELDRFVLTSVENRRYENEREAQEHEAKLVTVRTAIDEGDASGLAEPGVFDRVRQHLRLSGTNQ